MTRVKVVKMKVSSKVRMINTLKELSGFLWQGELKKKKIQNTIFT